MIKNVIDYLERSAICYGDKIAYVDINRSVSFSQLKNNAKAIARGIIRQVAIGEPVVVYMDKSVDCIESYLGVAYTGGFYVPIDVAMPEARVKLILDTLKAKIILVKTGEKLLDIMKIGYTIVNIDTCKDEPYDDINDRMINDRMKCAIDTNPIYAIFTSGSTGIPKGVLVSQKSVLNFTEWWCETFDFSDKEVFANQTPFYFDASVKDIYATLRCGATMYIVPKKLFSLPARLIEYLNDNKINCIDWVPSVLCMIVNFRTFEKVLPKYLKKVMFLGEVMPTKQFNMWRKALPNIQYANLYGPTEATGDCTYYKIVREIKDEETIPIGGACNNTDVFLLNSDMELVQNGEIGEICVRGCSLALGYYNNQEKTDEVFVQNPLQSNYKELIYKTGDLGRYNEYGELIFCSRKDAQIKHMGHRIELGEIENALNALSGINGICCLYNHSTQKIVCIYAGEVEKQVLIKYAKDKIPQYMIPQEYYQLNKMPINLNGKIDRTLLKKEYVKENNEL